MKKHLFAILAFITLGYTIASAQTSFGIEAGPTISNTVTKFGHNKTSSQLILGGIGGFYAIVPLSENLFLKPALLYQTKGGSEQAADGNKIKTHLNYLSLPINVLFKTPMQNGNGSWIVGLGPYVAYGISGKQTRTSDDTEVDLFKYEGLKRADAGINAALGFELS